MLEIEKRLSICLMSDMFQRAAPLNNLTDSGYGAAINQILPDFCHLKTFKEENDVVFHIEKGVCLMADPFLSDEDIGRDFRFERRVEHGEIHSFAPSRLVEAYCNLCRLRFEDDMYDFWIPRTDNSFICSSLLNPETGRIETLLPLSDILVGFPNGIIINNKCLLDKRFLELLHAFLMAIDERM